MKITNELMRETALYVDQYMQENMNPALHYHNENHTHHVVRACDIIGMNSGLGKQDRMTLHLAAWFHDIGYLTKPDGHEVLGASMAAAYFREKGLDKDTIANIESCILATRMPQQPTGLLEQVICDADLQYLGSEEFDYISGLLREEFAAEKGKVFTEEAWIRFNLDFLRNHGFFTAFARKEYDKQKRKNINNLEKKLKNLTDPPKGSDNVTADPSPHVEGDKENKLERGVETFFKITAGNQMRLNDMADNKANSIISINTLIISIVLSLLAPKLHNNEQLLVPVLLMILPSVAAIVIGVMATKPKILNSSFGTSGQKDIIPNVMFFGHFYNMEMKDYQQSVRELMYHKENLYDEISKDIYIRGKVLAKKFRLIAIGYMVFIIGLIISVIAFSAIFIFNAMN